MDTRAGRLLLSASLLLLLTAAAPQRRDLPSLGEILEVSIVNVGDIAHQTQRFEIPRSDLAKANASHFTYDVDVLMRNNTNRVAVGVLDEVSKAWSVTRLPVEREPRKEMR